MPDVVDVEIPAGESRDGRGAGDHDSVHVWGNWRACLTTMQQARLLVMRGYVRDHHGAIEGDSDYASATPSGLLVPTPYIARFWHPDLEAP